MITCVIVGAFALVMNINFDISIVTTIWGIVWLVGCAVRIITQDDEERP